jgi:hypothetical protein
LVVLVLMNTMGYYAVFYGLQLHSDITMSGVMDNESYDPSSTLTIKYPVSVPYMPDQAQFQRVDGKLLHEGQYLRIVKQRYAADTLTIVCLVDSESKQIHSALSDYIKTFADNAQQDNSKLTLSFIKDFIAQSFSIVTTATGWNMDVENNTSSRHETASYSSSIHHPPEHC